MNFRNREVGAKVVVLVEGPDIDSDVATDFKEHLIKTLESYTNAVLVIDLSRVRFVDSSGLGALFAAYRKTGSKRKIVIAEPQEPVKEVFEIARLEKIIPVVDNLDKALTLSAASWPIPPRR